MLWKLSISIRWRRQSCSGSRWGLYFGRVARKYVKANNFDCLYCLIDIDSFCDALSTRDGSMNPLEVYSYWHKLRTLHSCGIADKIEKRREEATCWVSYRASAIRLRFCKAPSPTQLRWGSLSWAPEIRWKIREMRSHSDEKRPACVPVSAGPTWKEIWTSCCAEYSLSESTFRVFLPVANSIYKWSTALFGNWRKCIGIYREGDAVGEALAPYGTRTGVLWLWGLKCCRVLLIICSPLTEFSCFRPE